MDFSQAVTTSNYFKPASLAWGSNFINDIWIEPSMLIVQHSYIIRPYIHRECVGNQPGVQIYSTVNFSKKSEKIKYLCKDGATFFDQYA